MIDPHSSSWLTTKAWAEKKLIQQRDRLESVECKEKEADIARGYVQAMKDLLGLPNTLERNVSRNVDVFNDL